MVVSNKEGLIKALWGYKEFTYGGHVKAWEWAKTFTVQDYNTVLLVKYNGALIYFNNKFYSKTTSRLQNLLKEVFNIVAPERKAYLFDTEPKEMYYTDATECYRGSAFFNSNGSLSFFAKKNLRKHSDRAVCGLFRFFFLDCAEYDQCHVAGCSDHAAASFACRTRI